jgi:hypothetical protein
MAVRNGPWNNPWTWSAGRVPSSSDIVEIGAAYTISAPPIQTTVRILYQDGILQSARNAPLALRATQALTNTGIIRGQPGSSTVGATCGAPGSSVFINRSREVYNYGAIIGGNGRGGGCCAGNGGDVEVRETTLLINYGSIRGGDGGSVGTCCATPTAGRGGYARVSSHQHGRYVNDGEIRGGNGGDQLAGCGNGKGGCGGDAIITHEQVDVLEHTLIIGDAGRNADGSQDTCGRIIIEPGSITINNTPIFGADIQIFGGMDWTLALTNTATGMISATRSITLAVGTGSSIDLRGCQANAFTAGERFFIASDNILLDAGQTLSDVVSAPIIEQSPAQILGNIGIGAPGFVRGTRGEALDISISLSNNSPVAFTYDLATTGGSGLPSTVSIAALNSTVVTLTVSAPALGGEQAITVTATAQASPFHSDRAVIRLYAPPETAEAALDQTFTGGVFYPFGGTLGCGGVTFAQTWTGALTVTMNELPGGSLLLPFLPRAYTLAVSAAPPTATLSLCYAQSDVENAGIEDETPLYLYQNGTMLPASTRDVDNAWVTAANVTLPGVFRIGLEQTERYIYLPLVLRQ